MSVKDYFKCFSSENFSYKDSNEIEYIIVFEKISKPNIKDFPGLWEIGRWTYYSDNGFCLFCKISKDKLENMLSEEIGISKGKFSVVRRNQFLGVGY